MKDDGYKFKCAPLTVSINDGSAVNSLKTLLQSRIRYDERHYNISQRTGRTNGISDAWINFFNSFLLPILLFTTAVKFAVC